MILDGIKLIKIHFDNDIYQYNVDICHLKKVRLIEVILYLEMTSD